MICKARWCCAPVLVATFLSPGCREPTEPPGSGQPAGSVVGKVSSALTHDLGEIDFKGAPVHLTHVFQLTNDSSDQVTIEDVIPSCGCLEVVPSANTFDPGGVIDVPVTVSVRKAGKFRHRVHLVTSAQHIFECVLEGEAVATSGFTSTSQKVVSLKRGESRSFVLTTFTTPEAEPAVPEFGSAGDQLSLELAQWRRVYSTGDLIRWQSIVNVSRNNTPDEPDSIGGETLHLKAGDTSVEIDVRFVRG